MCQPAQRLYHLTAILSLKLTVQLRQRTDGGALANSVAETW